MDYSDKYENLINSDYCDYSRNKKHINRTNTFDIADKRAGSRMSVSKYLRVTNFYKMSKNHNFDRYIKYRTSDIK